MCLSLEFLEPLPYILLVFHFFLLDFDRLTINHLKCKVKTARVREIYVIEFKIS